MKKLLLSAALIAAMPAAHTFAQNATTPSPMPTQQADDKMVAKRQFNSFISMFEAGVSRKTLSVAQDGLMKSMAMMQETTAKWSRTAAAPDAKPDADMKKRIDRSNKLYGDIKMASVDPMANHAKITPMLKEFMQML